MQSSLKTPAIVSQRHQNIWESSYNKPQQIQSDQIEDVWFLGLWHPFELLKIVDLRNSINEIWAWSAFSFEDLSPNIFGLDRTQVHTCHKMTNVWFTGIAILRVFKGFPREHVWHMTCLSPIADNSEHAYWPVLVIRILRSPSVFPFRVYCGVWLGLVNCHSKT